MNDELAGVLNISNLDLSAGTEAVARAWRIDLPTVFVEHIGSATGAEVDRLCKLLLLGRITQTEFDAQCRDLPKSLKAAWDSLPLSAEDRAEEAVSASDT